MCFMATLDVFNGHPDAAPFRERDGPTTELAAKGFLSDFIRTSIDNTYSVQRK